MTNKLKQTRHIISGLYKIKSIDRKKNYSIDELRNVVIKSKQGKEVIEKLNDLGITNEYLKKNKLTFAQIILSPFLKE